MLRMIQCLTHLLSVVRRFEVIVNIYYYICIYIYCYDFLF